MRGRSGIWLALALAACSAKKDGGGAGTATAPGGGAASATASGAAHAPGTATASGAASATAADAAPAAGSAVASGAGSAVASGAGAPDAAAAAAARPLYYDRTLTAAELDGRSLRELSLMRNWIFARAGNPFRKQWLRDYFTAQPWYHALEATDESKLTAIDHANAKLIADREAGFTRAQLVAMKDAINALAAPTADDRIELTLISTRLGAWAGADAANAGAGASGDARSPLADPSRLDALLSLDDLGDLSRRDLRILRNTVYARRGYVFKTPLMQAWFAQMEWYHPDPAYTDARLTPVDQKNIHLIRSVEDDLGGPLTDAEQKNGDGWFAAS